MEEILDSPSPEADDETPDTRRVETVRLPSLDDDELGPGVQRVQASLEKGREGVYIDDPVVSMNNDQAQNSGSNSSFSSAMGTPNVSKKKPKHKVRTLDYYYQTKTGDSIQDLSKQLSRTRVSKSAAELCPVPDITSHLEDNDKGSSLSLPDPNEDKDKQSSESIISHSPDPLPQRTPIRGTKRRRNTSKKVDNYVETHDAQKAPTFTLDIQKFIQFLPADFQLNSIHKLEPSLLQTNNREFVPIPETGIDLFIRARAGLVLQVRSEKRAALLESYVQRGVLPRWSAHIDPLPGYLHPIAEKIAPVLEIQAQTFMAECAIALRNQARVVGERALYDQEVLERTFQRDKHGYQLAVTRLFDIRERERLRIHDTVESIKSNMTYEATNTEDVCNYIKGKINRKYSVGRGQNFSTRGRGTRGRARGGYGNRPRNDYQANQGPSTSQPRGGYSRGTYNNTRPGPSRGPYNRPPPPRYDNRDRSRDPLPSQQYSPPNPVHGVPHREGVNPSDEGRGRDRSRSPLEAVSRPSVAQGYDNNRVGPPTNNPRPNPVPQPSTSRDTQSLSDRDVESIANAFMQRFSQSK